MFIKLASNYVVVNMYLDGKDAGIVQNISTKESYYFESYSFRIIEKIGECMTNSSDFENMGYTQEELEKFISELVEEGICEITTKEEINEYRG